MALPIVERARERLADRPDLLQLVDDAVVAQFGLYAAEVKVLAALLLTDGSLLEAAKLTGTSNAAFQVAFDNLTARGLATVQKGHVSLEGMQQQLKVETDEEAAREANIPQPVIVLRSVPEQVAALARSSLNGAAALGRVYAFLFGRRASNYPLLGRFVKEFGSAGKAGRFLLEHLLDDFQGKEPLMALLPLAIAVNRGWRPDDAPDVEEQKAEASRADEASWRARMKRWLNNGGLEQNLADLDQWEHDSAMDYVDRYLSPEQAEADRRQVRLDFARYDKEGRPEL